MEFEKKKNSIDTCNLFTDIVMVYLVKYDMCSCRSNIWSKIILKIYKIKIFV